MKPPSRAAAFTLPELMIAMTLFSLLSLVMVTVYNSAFTAYSFGSDRMLLQQRLREALRRTTSYIVTATPPDSSVDAIYDLPVDTSETTYGSDLTFWTTEDFITDSGTRPTFDARNPQNFQFLYAVWLYRPDRPNNLQNVPARGAQNPREIAGNNIDDDGNGVKDDPFKGTLILTRLNPGPPPTIPLPNLTPPGANYRILARNVDDIRFQRFKQAGVTVRVSTSADSRAPNGQRRTVLFSLENRIQIPYYSIR